MNVAYLFIQFSVHEYFSCLHLLAIMINATVNIIYKFFLSIHTFLLLWEYIPRRGISVSYGHSYLTSENLPYCFGKQLYHFILQPALYLASNFSTLVLICFIVDIPASIQWYLIVTLIFIFLKLIMFSTFSCAHWLFVYLLRRKVYSSPLPIFKLCFLILD